MDDDLIVKTPPTNNSSVAPITDEAEDEAANVRMFDITPDLNISPAKDEVESSVPIKIPEIIIDKPFAPQPASPTSSVTNSATPKPNFTSPAQASPLASNPLSPSVKTLPKSLDGIALEIESAPQLKVSIPEYGPANPPTKTIGSTTFSFTKNANQPKGITSDPTQTDSTNPTAPSSLQEVVSSINLSGTPPKETVKTSPNDIPGLPSKPSDMKSGPNVKPIRTYEQDFAEAMAKRHLSTSSFVIAEDKKKELEKIPVPEYAVKKDIVRIAEDANIAKNAEILRASQAEKVDPYNPSHKTRNIILSIISIILISGGAYAGYYLYTRSPLAPATTPTPSPVLTNPTTVVTPQPKQTASQPVTTPKVNTVQPIQQFSASIISSNSRAIINVDGLNQTRILSLIESEISKNQAENSIKEIILAQTTGAKQTKVPASEIMNIAKISTPDIFNRSLGSDWMLGVFAGANGQKNSFIITTNDFFQNTFAGIIQWEKTMPEDLKQYLYSGPTPVINTEANSSTTNPVVTSDFTLRGTFKDRIIKNKDVREYVADNGHIIFLYSFISNNKLVITNSEEALQEIITRLEKATFVR